MVELLRVQRILRHGEHGHPAARQRRAERHERRGSNAREKARADDGGAGAGADADAAIDDADLTILLKTNQ